MKILFTFLLLSVCVSSFAQDSGSYKSYRSVWSIIPRFGVGDKETRSNFTTYASLGLRREFSLGKLISLNAIAAYSSAYGRFGNQNLNVLSAGAGATIYLNYIVSKIFNRDYSEQQVKRDQGYIDIAAEFNLNNTKYGSAGSIGGPRVEVNFARFNLGEKLFLSPKVGFHGLTINESIPQFNISGLAFFKYIGIAVGLNPKK
jgi:hypothetical protein